MAQRTPFLMMCDTCTALYIQGTPTLTACIYRGCGGAVRRPQIGDLVGYSSYFYYCDNCGLVQSVDTVYCRGCGITASVHLKTCSYSLIR